MRYFPYLVDVRADDLGARCNDTKRPRVAAPDGRRRGRIAVRPAGASGAVESVSTQHRNPGSYRRCGTIRGPRHQPGTADRGSSSFSEAFDATKSFATGEGGCVVTTDPGLAARVTESLNFGFFESRDSHSASINGKMSEYHAAVGLAELDAWPAKAQAFQTTANKYRAQLRGVGLADRLIAAPAVAGCYILFQCATSDEADGIQRSLSACGVDFRLWYGLRPPHPATLQRNTTRISCPSPPICAPLCSACRWRRTCRMSRFRRWSARLPPQWPSPDEESTGEHQGRSTSPVSLTHDDPSCARLRFSLPPAPQPLSIPRWLRSAGRLRAFRWSHWEPSVHVYVGRRSRAGSIRRMASAPSRCRDRMDVGELLRAGRGLGRVRRCVQVCSAGCRCAGWRWMPTCFRSRRRNPCFIRVYDSNAVAGVIAHYPPIFDFVFDQTTYRFSARSDESIRRRGQRLSTAW